MTLRYPDGTEVGPSLAPEYLTSERMAELRENAKRGYVQREEIAARRQAEVDAYDAKVRAGAVAEFEQRHADLAAKNLQPQVFAEGERIKESRLRSGQPITDLGELYDLAAEEVRRRVNLPSRYEQERNAQFEDMKRARDRLKGSK